MRTIIHLFVLSAILALTGCAGRIPPPDSQVMLATSSIGRAENAGASDAVPEELQLAREKLQKAEQAMQRREYLVAQRLAEQAIVDADLAGVKARTVKARQAAAALRESIRTLRDEAERHPVR
ncbi:MAG: hypothetical protein A2521_05025 [Deltaproteobacteria bacterium RIFOXYD12_FULL_57_12]|nr:MAG: hypothetical protein A2521_05025 [Deltaproteobacteria bacterium RIFOXYD12_FULL_57_12]